LVSRSQQQLWACEGHRQVEESAVTTGASKHGDQTPLGSWRLQGKQTNRYLVGPGYRDFVRFWMPFNGDFGLHDASWQTMQFGSTAYHQRGSHGCVHVPTKVMAWLYAWSRVGATVVTIHT
jgi:lipoprotein-anchoring transpeptidase ErfK/SrfK